MQRTIDASTRSVGEITIVDLVGQIDLGGSPGLRKTLLSSLKTTNHMAINLGGVSYIDSSGIASLIEVLQVEQGRQKTARVVWRGRSSFSGLATDASDRNF